MEALPTTGPGEFEATNIQASGMNPATCQMHGLRSSIVATIFHMRPSSLPAAPWPNPSFEATSQRPLRALCAAPQLKR